MITWRKKIIKKVKDAGFVDAYEMYSLIKKDYPAVTRIAITDLIKNLVADGLLVRVGQSEYYKPQDLKMIVEMV